MTQPTEVKRYSPDTEHDGASAHMTPHSFGDYVSYADFEALKRETEHANETIAALDRNASYMGTRIEQIIKERDQAHNAAVDACIELALDGHKKLCAQYHLDAQEQSTEYSKISVSLRKLKRG